MIDVPGHGSYQRTKLSLLGLKAVKKAKQFELQKVVRQIKRAKAEDPAHLDKLEQLLAELRTAKVDELVKIAAASVGIVEEENQATAERCDPSRYPAITRRILGAKCVTQHLYDMERVVESIKAAVAVEDPTADPEVDLDDNKKDHTGQNPSDQEVEHELDKDADQALAKLLATKRIRSSPSGEDAESPDDSDDMLLDDIHDGKTLNNQIAGQKSDSEDEENPGRRANDSNHQRKAIKKKKPKNRLGQRARRRLAGWDLHVDFRKGRPPQAGRKGDEVDNGKSPLRKKTQVSSAKDGSLTERRKAAVSNDRDGSKLIGSAPLHPSWELKKKQAKTLRPFLGKKVVFDDSD